MKAARAVEGPWCHRTSSARRTWQSSLAFSLLLGLAGCKVGSEDIEYWKGTVKGPGKIVAVMLAEKYPLELRTQAALALIDMERPDRDGTADLQQALQRLNDSERDEVMRGMVPGLEALMKQADANPAGTASSRQIRAKDAAFLLIAHAPADVKARLTNDVIAWYMEDFNGRSLAGNFSAEQVVRALGSPAAAELVKGLKARMPAAALVKMAQLIGQLGEPATRKEAGTKLIAIYDEMDSKDFVGWVKQSVQEQAARGGLKLEPAKLAKLADDNREIFVVEGALPAMKWLVDEPQVKSRLLAIASSPLPGEAGTNRRVRALQALEGRIGREDLQKVLALALDKSNPTSVRDYAFDRVGDARNPEALPALWPLVSSTEDARLRWRAGELVLAIGGPVVVADFFSRLPGGAEYPSEELEGYATRLGQMTPVPGELLRGQLASPNWFARIIALRFFERRGSLDDLKAIEALRDDKAPIKGPRWGKTKTVGEVATEATNAAKLRLGQGAK